MSSKYQAFVVFLLIPAFMEALNPNVFSVSIPGFPLTLGRLMFVVIGLYGLASSRLKTWHNRIFLGILVILFFCAIAAFSSDDRITSLSAAAGFGLLLFGSCGIARLYYYPSFRTLIDVFFIALFLYWLWYALDSVVFTGGFTSYAKIYTRGELVNHHVVGLALSVSSSYIVPRFFYRNDHINWLGFFTIGSALLGAFLVESRANFAFILVTILILLFTEKNRTIRRLILVLSTIMIIIISMNVLRQHIDSLNQRFNIRDVEYHKSSTDDRKMILEYAYEIVKENPMGRGLENIKIKIGNKRLLPHNQYVSFIIAGGLFTLFGIFIWLKEIIIIFIQTYLKRRYSWERGLNSFIMGGALTLLNFNLTIVTAENTGTFFFILISVGIFIAYYFKYGEFMQENINFNETGS